MFTGIVTAIGAVTSVDRKGDWSVRIAAPWACDEIEFKQWEQKTMTEMESDTCHWLQNIYWRLDQVSVVLVVRNKLWFDNGTQLLKDLWDTIVKERETGYEHRAPRKRARCDSKAKESKETMKCLCMLLYHL